jgi:hypothetical protein
MMPISFSCPHCGKRFQVDDELGGLRGRCKGCGGSFEVPLQSESAGPEEAVPELVLDDVPEPVAPSHVEEVPPEKPVPIDHANREQFGRAGKGLAILGGLALALPQVGLQLKILSFLSDEVQSAIGGVLLAIGCVLFGMSRARRPMRVLLYGGLGVVGLIVLLIVAGLVLPRAREAKPRPALAIEAAPPPAVATKKITPAKAQPKRAATAEDSSQPTQFRVSNGLFARTTGDRGNPYCLRAQVDYQQREPFLHSRVDLVVEAPNRQTTVGQGVLKADGTLTAKIFTREPLDGPFHVSIGELPVGGRQTGRKLEIRSNQIDMTEVPETELIPHDSRPR